MVTENGRGIELGDLESSIFTEWKPGGFLFVRVQSGSETGVVRLSNFEAQQLISFLLRTRPGSPDSPRSV